MSRQTTFNPAWLQEDLFNPWLANKQISDINLELSNMGKQAMISHSKGKKQIGKMKLLSGVKHEQVQLKSFFVPKTNSNSSAEGTKSTGLESLKVPILQKNLFSRAPSTSTGGATITKCIARGHVLNTEVLWAVKTVMSHILANSSSDTGDLFRRNVSRQPIVQTFKCRKTKCTNFITHGFAPYFHNNLLSILRDLLMSH